MSSSLMAVHDQQGLRSDAVALSMTSRMRGGMGLGHVLASREELTHVVSATETEVPNVSPPTRNFQEWAISTTVVLRPARRFDDDVDRVPVRENVVVNLAWSGKSFTADSPRIRSASWGVTRGAPFLWSQLTRVVSRPIV
jgi:hypothetical protein